MATPVEPVDEELGFSIQCWFSVKVVSMKLTGIVVEDGVRWNWNSRMTSIFKTSANKVIKALNSPDHEDDRDEETQIHFPPLPAPLLQMNARTLQSVVTLMLGTSTSIGQEKLPLGGPNMWSFQAPGKFQLHARGPSVHH